MTLPYRHILALLRPAAAPCTVYRAEDGSDDFCQCWRFSDGRELLVETLAQDVGRLWRPVPIVGAVDLRRTLDERC